MQKFKERVSLWKAAPYTEIRGSKLNRMLCWPARVLVCLMAVMLFMGMSNPGQTAMLGRASLSQLASVDDTKGGLLASGLTELKDYYAQANDLVNALDVAAAQLEAQSDALLAAIGEDTMVNAVVQIDNSADTVQAADVALDRTLRSEIAAYQATLATDMLEKLASYEMASASMQLAGDAIRASAADPENADLASEMEMALYSANGDVGMLPIVDERLEKTLPLIANMMTGALNDPEPAQPEQKAEAGTAVEAEKAETEALTKRLEAVFNTDLALCLAELRTTLAQASELGAVENGAEKLQAYDAVLSELEQLQAAMSELNSFDAEAEPKEGEKLPDYNTLLGAFEVELSEVETALNALEQEVPELAAINGILSRQIAEAINPAEQSAVDRHTRVADAYATAEAAFNELYGLVKAENDRQTANKKLAEEALSANSAAMTEVEAAVEATRAALAEAEMAVDAAQAQYKLREDSRTDTAEKIAAVEAALAELVPVANEKITAAAEAMRSCAASLLAAKEPSGIAGAELPEEQTDTLVTTSQILLAVVMIGLVGLVMSLGNNRMRKMGLALMILCAGVSIVVLTVMKSAHAGIALHVEQLREAHGLADLSESLAAAVAKLALDVPDALLVFLTAAILMALFSLAAFVTLPRKVEEHAKIDMLTICQRLTRVLIIVTGLLVFLPNLNPGRVSALINENASLFTMAISYGTIVEKLDSVIVDGILSAGSVKLLMGGAAVVMLGIVLNAAGACMSLGNNRMKKKGGYLLPMAGSAAILLGLFIIFNVYNTFNQTALADAGNMERIQPMLPGSLIFWAVAAVAIFASSFAAWYLLPDELEEKMEMEEKYRNFLMFLPVLLLTFIFCYLPIWGWRFAFFDYKIGDQLLLNDVVENGAVVQNSNYVGLKWFTYLFENPANREDLVRVLRNTLIMSGLGIATSWLPIAFAVLLAEVRSSKFQRLVQTLTTIPNFISWVLVYAIAFAIFSTDGFINSFLENILGISANTDYLASADWIWVKMLLWGTWKGLGWSAIVYIAGIAGIDQQLYEAARVDGANRFQCIRHITIPGLIPTYMVMLLMSVAGMLSNGMDQYLVFENAINKDVIEVLDLYVYNIGIKSGLIPLSTVVGVFKSLIGVTLLFGANGISKAIRGESII